MSDQKKFYIISLTQNRKKDARIEEVFWRVSETYNLKIGTDWSVILNGHSESKAYVYSEEMFNDRRIKGVIKRHDLPVTVRVVDLTDSNL